MGRAASVIVSPICTSATALIEAVRKPTSPTPKLIDRRRTRAIHAQRFHLVIATGVEEANLHSRSNRAVDHAKQNDHAAIGVVPRIEDQRLQRRVRIAFRRRHIAHDCFQNFGDAFAGLGAGENRVVSFQADEVFDLFDCFFRFGARQIDLVDDRNQLEIVFDREISVRERLRFDALRSIDDQQRAFAGGKRTRNFVREIDVARRVDQIQHVRLAVLRFVIEPDRVGLDRDAALALEIHVVEHLRCHIAVGHRAGQFEQAVGERRLAVIDVGDDREVADAICCHSCGAGESRIIVGLLASHYRRMTPTTKTLVFNFVK